MGRRATSAVRAGSSREASAQLPPACRYCGCAATLLDALSRGDGDDGRCCYRSATTKLRSLRDAARLDWLADPNNQIGNVQIPTDCVLAHPESMRAAIDMAMRMEDSNLTACSTVVAHAPKCLICNAGPHP